MKKRILIFVIIFIFSFAMFEYLDKRGVEFNIEFINILFFFLFIHLMVYVHETGHVIAGLSTGIGISRVLFGKGKDILRKRIFGILIIFKNRLGGGYTFVGEMKNGFSKPSFLFFTSGGMLLQLAITIPIILITNFKPSDFFNSYNANISASFIVANLLLIILTIIPMKINFQGIKIPNDGMNILRIHFMKQKDINEILSAGKIMEAYEFYEARKYNDAQLAFEKCINDFPDSIVAQIDYSATLIKLLKFQKAEEKLLEIKNNKHDKKYNLIIYNNLAWIKLLVFTNESLKEADHFSKKAYKINSNIFYVKGTRGSTLIALGRYDEGIKILKNSINFNKAIDRETNSIVHFIVLSFAYLKKNEKKTANKYIEKVKKNLDKMDDDDKHLFEILINLSSNYDGYFSAEKGEKIIPDRNIQQHAQP